MRDSETNRGNLRVKERQEEIEEAISSMRYLEIPMGEPGRRTVAAEQR